MKIRTILHLVFFVSCFAHAAVVSNPIIPTLPDLVVCDGNADGFESFDLTQQTPIVLAAQSSAPSDYTVNYYTSQIDANLGFNAISNTSSYFNITNPQTIYVRVVNLVTSEYSVGNFTIIAYPPLTPVFTPIAPICQNTTPPVLPFTSANGITGTWSPSTIDTSVLGTTIYTFTPDFGQCASIVTMAITVAPSATLYLVSSAATITQTVCVNSPISNIVYVFGGNATGASVTGLPSSFSVSISGSTVTISGVAATSGFYPYTITTIGGCYQSLNGSITVTAQSTLTLVSAPPTTNQTVCWNSPITDIVYQVGGGATGALVSGLPPGVTTSVLGSVVTIYGAPAVSGGSFPFTVTTTGGCTTQILTGTINVTTPQVYIPANFVTCDVDGANDGYSSYPLDVLIPSILGGQSPSNFTVNFYNDQASAYNDINAITNLANYQTYTHTIWFRVTNNVSGCYRISNFYTQIEQTPQPIITASSNAVCVDVSSHSVLNSLVLTAVNTTNYLPQNSVNYTYQWYANGLAIIGATSSTYLLTSPSLDNVATIFSVTMTSTSPLGCVQFSTDFTVLQSGPASPIGIGYSIVNNAGNQTVTVDCQGYGTYEYSLDGGVQQTSNIFSNVPLGLHTITVWDIEGNCDPLVLSNVDVNLTATPPPTGNTIQSFSYGATLGDVVVSGQNIQWYSGANKNAAATSLPLNTVLVNGTTYYASQKIGGYESTTRLPVTVQVSLSNAEFELTGLTYAPNPVASQLHVKGNETIDNISFYNLLGQLVHDQKAMDSEVQVDLSELKSGNYFVKVSSGSKNHVFKIIKE